MILNSNAVTREEVMDRYVNMYGMSREDAEKMGKRNISFTYEGVRYEANMVDCYDLGKNIKLPDGTLLQARGWFESLPPQPAGLTVVQDLFPDELNSTPAVAVPL